MTGSHQATEQELREKMERLIQEYRQGRRELQELKKRIDLQIAADDGDKIMDLYNDRSLVNSMIRDMTESISMMSSSHYRLRGSVQDQKVQIMDPDLIKELDVQTYKWDPDSEVLLKNRIMDEYWGIIQTRMEFLTSKQRTTLERWINMGKSISDISREDNVSRQAVWVRLFGDRTNKGALRILRDGR